MRCFYAKTPHGDINGIGCSRTQNPSSCRYRQAALNSKLRDTFTPEFSISEMQVLCDLYECIKCCNAAESAATTNTIGRAMINLRKSSAGFHGSRARKRMSRNPIITRNSSVKSIKSTGILRTSVWTTCTNVQPRYPIGMMLSV